MNNKFWSFKSLANNEGELMLYGEISSESWWGDEVTPKQFKADLDTLGDIHTLNVYINSPGGDVFAGQAIHTMLKRHKAHVNVYIDGLAASIASVIAMAGDTVYMGKNTMMMIHNPWTGAYGNEHDFRKLAEDLNKIRESLIEAYLSKAKDMDRDKLIEMLDAETWLTAQECIDYGFASELTEGKNIAASIDALVFNRYKNIPKSLKLNKENVQEDKAKNEMLAEVDKVLKNSEIFLTLHKSK